MRKRLLAIILLLVFSLIVVAGVILYQETQYAQSIQYYDSLRTR